MQTGVKISDNIINGDFHTKSHRYISNFHFWQLVLLSFVLLTLFYFFSYDPHNIEMHLQYNLPHQHHAFYL